MTRAFIDTHHQIWLEPEPGGVGARLTDAEYLPLTFAESFGATPPARTGIAYVIHTPSNRAELPARHVITGVTLDRPSDTASEIRIIFNAIKACVEKYNSESRDPILSVGIADEFLAPDRFDPAQLRQVISDVGL